MADTDDLAAVWGPDGLATTNPSAVRTVPPGAADEPVRSVAIWPAPPPRRRSLPSPKVVLAAGVLVLGTLVVALALANLRRSHDDERVAAAADRIEVPATSTTIVSAAADLLHRDADDAAPLPTVTLTDEPPVDDAPPPQQLHGADDAAAAFTRAMNAADCDAVWNLLSSRTREFFATLVRDTDEAPDSLLCESLREESPRTTIAGPARSVGGGGKVVVPISADGDVEDITFVLEQGAWVVDLLALQETRATPSDAEQVQSMLREAATAEAAALAQHGRFSDDPALLRELDRDLIWQRGVAPVDADLFEVYVQLADTDTDTDTDTGGRSVVCLSARAQNGARFLLKRSADGATTYAGGEIPAACDPSPLAPSW